MRMLSYGVYLVCFFMMSCASHQSTTSTASATGKYSEDLSSVRPKIEALPLENTPVTTGTVEHKQTAYVEPKRAVNQQLDQVLDSIDHNNLTRQAIDGFTIQVYSGSKDEALNIRRQLSSHVPGINSEVQFTQPNFRVKAGRYYNRLDAQKDFLAVKRYFPNAILIPDRIAIN